jgi:hypothetical protein
MDSFRPLADPLPSWRDLLRPSCCQFLIRGQRLELDADLPFAGVELGEAGISSLLIDVGFAVIQFDGDRCIHHRHKAL